MTPQEELEYAALWRDHGLAFRCLDNARYRERDDMYVIHCHHTGDIEDWVDGKHVRRMRQLLEKKNAESNCYC